MLMRAHGPGRDRDRLLWWTETQNSVQLIAQLIGSSRCWRGGWHGLPTLDSLECGRAEFVTMYASEAFWKLGVERRKCKFAGWEINARGPQIASMLAKAVCVFGAGQRAARSNYSARSVRSWGFLQSSGLWFSLHLSPEPETWVCQKQKHNCQSDSRLLRS